MTETLKHDDLSKLNSEEELDVLLPIYTLGKAQGRDLLKPEQVKKLLDSGRIRLMGSGEYEEIEKEKTEYPKETALIMANTFMSILIDGFERVLIEDLHFCSYEQWESKKPLAKSAMLDIAFHIEFEMDLGELENSMYKYYSGNTK